MLKIYDKAQWHIDAGEDPAVVIAKLKKVFSFLDAKRMLTDEGKEILDLGVDSSVSIHERMLNDMGNQFMEQCYDKVINSDPENITTELEMEFDIFINS